ncbi:MAG: ABC transporter permease [Phycisphaerales bacterium]|nr:ABC transporter permease [Phycisphaerales bacterium]
MRRIARIAQREFVSTITTKGFLIGVLIVPVMAVGAIAAINLLWNDEAPAVTGTVSLIDRSGVVAKEIQSRINPVAMAIDRDAEVDRKVRELADKAGEVLGDEMAGAAAAALRGEAEKLVGPASDIRIDLLDADADEEEAKEPLRIGTVQDGGQLALVVIDENAVQRDVDGRYGSYSWFARARLDDRVQSQLRWKVHHSIVDLRIRATGQDPDEVREMVTASARQAKTVTASGEVSSTADEVLSLLLPMGFMMLLWVSAFTGGQYLLTTTIEEKSSRVIEVLLSAVSPVQLMTGKIIGQMGVGLLILMIYSGLSIAALITFSLMGFIEPVDLAYLAIFFFIAFFFIASMMAAIGSAVNDMREAQSLMTPVMLVMIIPMLLWMPIARDPNSTFAVVLSIVPPISPFAMVVRLASSEPVPFWQIAISIVVGVVSVYIMVRLAAKVFRIGVLMYGKPPNFVTLLRWVKQA